MASSSPVSVPSVTLDQLIALNDEIAALVRVGVPLDQALTQLGADLPGRGGKIATLVGEQLQQGKPLEQVLAENPGAFPPIYRAVVQAGLKTGRLASALEGMATSARRLAETRRMVAASFLYPLLVFLLAWGLFVFFVAKLVDPFLGFIHDLAAPNLVVSIVQAILTQLVRWRVTLDIWGWAVPVVVVFAAGLWWYRSSRATLVEPGAADAFLGWLPWTGRMLRLFRTAALADVLALLVEHQVPLDQAIVLAAEAVGGSRLTGSARQLAEAIQRGEPLGRQQGKSKELPPLLAWLMIAGQQRGAMATALRRAAEAYEQRARLQADAARRFVPILLTLGIGGTVTLLYAALVLGTWFSVLRSLAEMV